MNRTKLALPVEVVVWERFKLDNFADILSGDPTLLHEPTIFDFQRGLQSGGRGQGHLLNPIHFPSKGASRFNLGLEFDIFKTCTIRTCTLKCHV